MMEKLVEPMTNPMSANSLCSDLFTSERDRAETPLGAEASEAGRFWDRVAQAWPGLSPEDQRTIADLVSRMAQWPNPGV